MTQPQPSGGFEWVQAPRGPVLRCSPLEPFAHHFFTARSLRLREHEAEWEEVAGLAGVPRGRLLLLHQVHGRTIAVAPRDFEPPNHRTTEPSIHQTIDWRRPEADAVISNDPFSALVVRVADCAPILLADRRGRAVAAIHAGWRSTMQRIVDAAVMAMRDTFGTSAGDLIAAIGPSLGPCCGEMGEEVVEAFRQAGHGRDVIERWFVREPGRRPHFDLWRANRDQLEEAGVPRAAIHSSALCTRSHAEVFHSYRAEGPTAGRMAAVIRANPLTAHAV